MAASPAFLPAGPLPTPLRPDWERSLSASGGERGELSNTVSGYQETLKQDHSSPASEKIGTDFYTAPPSSRITQYF
jgi:hypothetical protein